MIENPGAHGPPADTHGNDYHQSRNELMGLIFSKSLSLLRYVKQCH